MKKDKNEDKSKRNAESREKHATHENMIDADPLGMWTGVPDDPYDEPVQDADDL